MNTRDPEALLDNWLTLELPFQARPELVAELTEGISNKSYLILADGERWVLRLDAPQASNLGVDRAQEHLIHRAAAAKGLAPECLVADLEHGFMVTRFIEGGRFGKSSDANSRLNSLHALLLKLQEVDVGLNTLDYRSHLARYSNDGGFSTQISECLDHLETAADVGLCHHDPSPANVVFTASGACLIDWEYAAVGRPVMDLAALVCEWKLEANKIAMKFDVKMSLLRDACIIYQEMCRLWESAARDLHMI